MASRRSAVPATDLPTASHLLEVPAGSALMEEAPQFPEVVEQGIATLLADVRTYSPAANLDLVERAARFAAAAHSNDIRKSGEPYVMHPIAVAAILARVQLDGETLAGALLHDVVEDTPVELSEIEEAFGTRVARLVDGVSKLGRIPWTRDDDAAGGSREQPCAAEGHPRHYRVWQYAHHHA